MADPTPSDAADRPPERAQPDQVGSAYMQPDGTLEMSLRTETRDGTIGESLLVVAKGDPRYANMVKHLGGIQPGEGKPIPPFPSSDAD